MDFLSKQQNFNQFNHINQINNIYTSLNQIQSESFIVEKLLEKKKKNGTVLYKVKWEDGHHPTWEPRGNFINCESLFAQFDKNKGSNSNSSKNNSKGNIKQDTPLKILWRVPNEDRSTNLAFLVEWRERTNGYIPTKSICYQSELRKKAPRVLLKFYEKFLIIKKNEVEEH